MFKILIGIILYGSAIMLIAMYLGYRNGHKDGRKSFVEESGYHTVYNDRVQVKTKNLKGQPCIITVYSEGLNYKGEFLVRVQRDPWVYATDELFHYAILKNPYEDKE